MSFLTIFVLSLSVILTMMVVVWLWSLKLKDASIVDAFWGLGFVVICLTYNILVPEYSNRAQIVLFLVMVWGLRLSWHIAIRNHGKPEDFRYQKFRKDYGPHRYWWISLFQVFLLQGFLLWIVSLPLLASQYYGANQPLGVLDGIAMLLWLIGFAFEAGGDYQLKKFKANQTNRGKLLQTGFWKYTRHPNYFGDAAVWWAFGLFGVAAGSFWTFIGSIIMTILLVKVSGVALLEKSMKQQKPDYADYVQRTSAFIPWFPNKKN
jgi:steroid 5-alpha reductase family enzyme